MKYKFFSSVIEIIDFCNDNMIDNKVICIFKNSDDNYILIWKGD